MPAHTAVHDPGGTLHLRPRSAAIICAVVGLIGLGLSLEAVLRAGWEGVLVLPVPLFALALVWMVLWAPQVVLHEESVEVRNVLLTHHLPFAAIQEVRIGAMLRFEVTTHRAATSTVTAWNAPALGRDAPWRREATMYEQNLRGRSSTPQERLVNDQQRSRSAVVKTRWERWMDRRDAAGRTPADEAEGVMVTTPNVLQLAVVAILGLLVLARAVL
ncbi:PH domain-containing protein [Brachybacterium vulturis]|uniref:PH domain-containing protein n=1 Tax=Brachybacterium vulturis TaxID=2017484 RepID=UPI0037362994